MICLYCGTERRITHPFLIVKAETGCQMKVYVCPNCAVEHRISELIIQIGFELIVKDKKRSEEAYAKMKASVCVETSKEGKTT
ncbi:MAG: hypothetical protein PHC63_07040 [Candidatus Bathyarchaeota archaeon]|nr:hypothetical protein [Candidatus Bathyarchaeota archaeon]